MSNALVFPRIIEFNKSINSCSTPHRFKGLIQFNNQFKGGKGGGIELNQILEIGDNYQK